MHAAHCHHARGRPFTFRVVSPAYCRALLHLVVKLAFKGEELTLGVLSAASSRTALNSCTATSDCKILDCKRQKEASVGNHIKG